MWLLPSASTNNFCTSWSFPYSLRAIGTLPYQYDTLASKSHEIPSILSSGSHVDITTLSEHLRHRPMSNVKIVGLSNAVVNGDFYGLVILISTALRLNKFRRAHRCNVLSVHGGLASPPLCYELSFEAARKELHVSMR